MRGSLPFVVLAGIGIAGLGLGIVKRLSKPSDPRGSGISPRSSQLERRYIAADRLDCGAMLLAGSVLLDSSIEHYRGNFARAAMYMPLGSAGAAIFASGHGISRRSSDIVRVAMHASAVITGLVGLGFHALNIVKRPGGISWHNLFYAAPAGAPAAL